MILNKNAFHLNLIVDLYEFWLRKWGYLFDNSRLERRILEGGSVASKSFNLSFDFLYRETIWLHLYLSILHLYTI